MARKTNRTINAANGTTYEYARIRRKVGMKQNKRGEWVADYRDFYGESKKDAEAKYQAYMQRGSLSAELPFGQLMDQYINNVFLPDSSLKETSKTRYANAYYYIFKNNKIAGASVKDVTGADIQNVLSNSTAAASSVRAAYKMVRLFYRYLERQHIANDITAGIALPAVEHRRSDQNIETFTDEELRRFLDLTPVDHRLRLLVVLGINTGARIAELLALTYDDIVGSQLSINKSLAEIDPIVKDRKDRAERKKRKDREIEKSRTEVTTTKTLSSIRSVPLSDDVLKEIDRHKKWHAAEMLRNGYRTNYIFTSSSGALYYKSTIRTAFTRLCKRVGVTPRGFHCFRHTFGSRLAAAGVPLQTTSKLMGHTGINVTNQYYINVEENEKRNAIQKITFGVKMG